MVLAGGGHAHVLALKRWMREPIEGCELTLISESQEQLYSGMLPGYIRGEYQKEEVRFDLKKLCEKANTRFIEAQITGFDKNKRSVRIARCINAVNTNATGTDVSADLQQVPYDFISLNLGAQPTWTGSVSHFKPFHRFMEVWQKIKSHKSPRLAVFGGGPAGVEISLAMNEVIRSKGGRVHLFEKHERLISSWPEGASRIVLNKLSQEGIEVQLSHEVQSSEQELKDFDFIFGADGPKPSQAIKDSGWLLDQEGFLLVDQCLRIFNGIDAFAAGDMVTFSPEPHAKSGVYAIRHAEVLTHNLWEAIRSRLKNQNSSGRLKTYQPQKTAMYLLNLGRKEALFVKGSWYFKSRLAWRLKDWIDRRFMRTGEC